ncbi:MAG: glycoside hydrolase family 78 protein [Propionibacteriaceae bacterium]|jgi:alpha-L-rhamnosidase|nr:glycoside hydrolase family 78 protein [Propionibacteriaceae bacterium]
MPQWQAQFIAHSRPCAEGDPAPYFRKSFTVEPDLVRATLYVTALGVVEPYVNGTRVGEDILAPGWTAYRERLGVNEYDVTPLLTDGPNALGAIVGEGWAVGRLMWSGANHHYADRPALFMQLELAYPGRTAVVPTEPSSAPTKATDWQVGVGGVRANGLYDGETFDARLEPPGWSRADFIPADWGPAIRYDWNLDSLELRVQPPIRRIEELPVAAITTSPTGYPILDFGQNLTGWIRLILDNPRRGQDITIRHAESLTPEGALERETNRTAKATDRYIAAGEPRETWEPRFTFHGFRYAEVEGWKPNRDAVRAVVIHSDMARHGWFECSNPLLNRFHANTVWSMRGNFVGLPTDCPQRDERLGWTGDLNAFIPTATYLYDVRGVVGSWLTDLMIEQTRVGNMPRSAPLVDQRPSQPTALWGDAIVNVPWQMFWEYGDVDVLRRCWRTMCSFVDEVATLLDDHDLWSTGFQYGDWCDPDAPPREPGRGKTDPYLVAQAFYARTTAQMTQIAGLLGESAAADRYAELDARVRAAFRREYVSERGIVKGETSTGYALALCFDLLDAGQRAYAGKRLNSLMAGRGYTISSGFAGTPFIADALMATGHLDGAYKLLLQTDCPSFLYPVTMGATTIWERWDAIQPDGWLYRTGMTSLNHYALGAVSDWIHRVVGGLAAAEPGWTRITVAPRPGGGLTHASTSHLTPLGLAAVSWALTGGEMTATVVVPAGATAAVRLPLHPEDLAVTVGPGEHTWAYAAQVQ